MCKNVLLSCQINPYFQKPQQFNEYKLCSYHLLLKESMFILLLQLVTEYIIYFRMDHKDLELYEKLLIYL